MTLFIFYLGMVLGTGIGMTLANLLKNAHQGGIRISDMPEWETIELHPIDERNGHGR
jgi:nitrogen-specific signal transduction histidine kinase